MGNENRITYLPPIEEYETFHDAAHYAEKLKEWGLASKDHFWYKEGNLKAKVSILGYIVYGKTDEYNTIVIEFEDGNLSCIHPAYLKEMQANSFSKAVSSEAATIPVPTKSGEESKTEVKPEPKATKAKKDKPQKIELPEEKVHFTAEVLQFALSWNHFNEENDEVVVLKDVTIEMDPPLEIGQAWCSHSKTLKKFELSPGDKLEFDGKIVKKKLPSGKDVEEEFIIKEPVSYKINNPSKIKKG